MSNWRDIWKESIEASRKTILENDRKEKIYFKILKEKYNSDKMVIFESGITYACLKNYNDAIAVYEQVSAETGLPVRHWRNVAAFFLEIANMKRHHCAMPESWEEKLLMGNKDSDYCRQWNSFFYLHTFVKLPPHIRYLAISSMSRIDSESEMAAIVFRTCMEVALKLLYPEYEEKKNLKLEDITNDLYNQKIITEPLKNRCDIIRKNGNSASHTGELCSNIEEIIIAFMYVMDFCNEKFGY